MSAPSQEGTRTEPHEEEPPPLLGSWPRLYAVVLSGLIIEIILFYLVTRAFS